MTINILDASLEYIPKFQNSIRSYFLPHRYNLRPLLSRRLGTDTSTLNFSALPSYSALRLARQHAKPLFSDKHSSDLVPQSFHTSGVETASVLSSYVQTAYLSGNPFVLKILYPLLSLHKCFYLNISQQNVPDTQLLMQTTCWPYNYSRPKNDPSFPVLSERFIRSKDILSNKRKETELERLQNTDLELTFEGKVEFQALNHHECFISLKLNTRQLQLRMKPRIWYLIVIRKVLISPMAKLYSTIPIQDFNILHLFNTIISHLMTQTFWSY